MTIIRPSSPRRVNQETPRTPSRERFLLACLAAVPALLAGCAAHNLTPVALETSPGVNTRAAETFSPATYGSFSVFPISRVDSAPPDQEGPDERRLLFMLRNAMETRGYRFVRLNESPDLLLTVRVTAEPIPRVPQVIEPPELPADGLVPDPQATATLLGDRAAASAWGSWQAAARFESPLPKYPPGHGEKEAGGEVLTETRVSVAAIDAKTLREVWVGAGRGFSRTPDPHINSQLVLRSVIRRFPVGSTPELIIRPGVPGLEVDILTNDGTHYFPAVTGIRSGSPALRGGMKQWDMILALDAATTADQSYGEFRGRLVGESGTNLTMALWRNGRQYHVTIPRREPPRGTAGVPPPPGEKPADELFVPRRTASTGLIFSGIGAAALAVLVVLAAMGL